MKTKNLTLMSILLASALCLGFIESLLPPFIPIAGAKIGLCNIVILFSLYTLKNRHTLLLCILKVIITCIWFSHLSAFLYSLFGTLLAIFVMLLFKKFSFSHYVVSAVGGIFHNVGQLIAACLILKTAAVFYLLPYLLLLGFICGFFTGTICHLLLKYFDKFLK